MQVIQTVHIVQIQAAKKICHCHCKGISHGAVCNISFHCEALRNVNLIGKIIRQIQAVLQSRNCNSHYHFLISIRDYLSIIYGNIGKMIRGKDHTGYHNKWRINFHIFLIYFNGFLRIVGIGNFHTKMSTFASQLIWCDFLVIQIILDLHIYRKLFICGSLIINITAVCIPGYVLSVLGKGLIPFDIFDVIQVRYI